VQAVCRDKGAGGISDRLRTAGRPAAIQLTSDAGTIGSDFDSMIYVRARVVDAKGVTVPNAEHLLHFSVEGAGELIATDNGSVTDHRPFASPDRQPREGTAVALVRGAGDGRFTVKVRADGLASGSIELQARKGR
jgi:beta-galactosidase